jgi:hypothetical protein
METNLRAGKAERKFVSENKPAATFERNEHSEWERICAQAKPSESRYSDHRLLNLLYFV